MTHRCYRLLVGVIVCACISAPARAQRDSATADYLRHVVLFAPKPDYSLAARSQHLAGSGMYLVQLRADGVVESVSVVKSTGHRELDQSCIDAFRQWRFRSDFARRFGKAKIPVTFTMAGAHY